MLSRTRKTVFRTQPAQRNIAGLFVLPLLLITACFTGGFRADAQTRMRFTLADSMLVHAIDVVGDSAFNRKILLQHLSTRETPGGFAIFLFSISERLPFAAEPQYFDYETFQSDLEALRFFYQNNGFTNARIDGRVDTVPGLRAVRVTIDVQEGRASYIDSVAYKRIDELPEDVRGEILREPRIRPGLQYNADNLKDELSRISTILGNSGYPLATIGDIVVERRLSNNNMFIPIPINPGRRLHFGAIRDSLIGVEELNLARRILNARLDFREGDWYSNKKRQSSELNLARLGLFSSISISPLFPGSRDTLTTAVPMVLAIAPRKQNEPDIGILVNNTFGRVNLGASLSYVLRNPFGSATTLTTQVNFLTKADLPIEHYQATSQIRLDQPYFLHNDLSASISVAYILANERGLYVGNIFQVVPSVQWRMADRLNMLTRWTLERTRYEEISRSLSGTIFEDYDTTGIPFLNSILSVTLDKDMTNDVYYPTDGQSLRGTVEEAGILTGLIHRIEPQWLATYQSTQYWKIEGMLRLFRDLSRNGTSIFGLKLRTGGIFRYGDSLARSTPVPVLWRYFAGGSTGNRGWHSRTLSALGESFAGNGGHALVEASAELRWQVFPGTKPWWVFEPDKIWLVLFSDAGNLWDEPHKIRLNDIAIAFGLGFRYNLFIGPIRIDYAFRLYDPVSPGAAWFTHRAFWSDVAAKGLIQFGIGHAF